jgi:hypothetical protein
MKSILLCFALIGATVAIAAAQTLSGKPTNSEAAFVANIQSDLQARFPTVADAEKAGYFRFTNVDKSGAISYANLNWQSIDQHHPSQLWYSPDGRLLGADYSVLESNSRERPAIWGIDPRRWIRLPAHVHYITVDDNGSLSYGHYIMAEKFAAAGGDPHNPQPATLVKLDVVKSASAVKKIFFFPALWDVQVWVINNPNGAFAVLNPLVDTSMGSMH